MGDCLADEHHNPANGDGLQETTGGNAKGGLLVWRKVDDFTAFTDGYRSLINSPSSVARSAPGAVATRSSQPDYMVRGTTSFRLIGDELGTLRLVVNTSDPRDKGKGDNSGGGPLTLGPFSFSPKVSWPSLSDPDPLGCEA